MKIHFKTTPNQHHDVCIEIQVNLTDVDEFWMQCLNQCSTICDHFFGWYALPSRFDYDPRVNVPIMLAEGFFVLFIGAFSFFAFSK